ncbi:MAG: hypothetical protein ACRDGM_17865 [bacterium]
MERPSFRTRPHQIFLLGSVLLTSLALVSLLRAPAWFRASLRSPIPILTLTLDYAFTPQEE